MEGALDFNQDVLLAKRKLPGTMEAQLIEYWLCNESRQQGRTCAPRDLEIWETEIYMLQDEIITNLSSSYPHSHHVATQLRKKSTCMHRPNTRSRFFCIGNELETANIKPFKTQSLIFSPISASYCSWLPQMPKGSVKDALQKFSSGKENAYPGKSPEGRTLMRWATSHLGGLLLLITCGCNQV